MKKNIFWIGIVLISIFSCETKIEVNAPYDDVPIVYCILDPDDSEHYVKINKSFLGEAAAYEMAQECDSLFYDSVEVTLERISNGQTEQIHYLEKIDFAQEPGYVAPEGSFCKDKNILYRTTDDIQFDKDYKLSIHILDNDKWLYAQTSIPEQFTEDYIPGSALSKPKLSFADINKSEEFEWKSKEDIRLYEVNVYINILEVVGMDTSALPPIKVVLPTQTTTNLDGGESMSVFLSGGRFLNAIAANLDPNFTGKRIVKKNIDINFIMAGDDLNTFIQVNKPAGGIVQEKPTFTNIENGIGILGCRFDYMLSKEITSNTIDSVSRGSVTCDLKFVDSNDMYYYTK